MVIVHLAMTERAKTTNCLVMTVVIPTAFQDLDNITMQLGNGGTDFHDIATSSRSGSR